MRDSLDQGLCTPQECDLQAMVDAVSKDAERFTPSEIIEACIRAIEHHLSYIHNYFHPVDFQVIAEKAAKKGRDSLTTEEYYIYEIENKIKELNALLPRVVLGLEYDDEWFCLRMELLFLVRIYEVSKQRNFAPLPPGTSIFGQLRITES